MKKKYPKESIKNLSELFGYKRQNFYKVVKGNKGKEKYEEEVLEIVKEIREDQPRIGTIKLQYLINKRLKDRGIGRDRLNNLLRSKKLLIRKRKRYRPKLTDGDGNSLYEDLRKGFKVERINQLWCSDITYVDLKTKENHSYLVCITDEYSHLIVGYHFGLRMRKEEVIKALEMALRVELPCGRSGFEDRLIFHTDRGGQYKSGVVCKLVGKSNMVSSMTKAGKSYENPVAERLNGILKHELFKKQSFDSFEEASNAVEKAIRIYNEQRPHLSCNMLTPKEAHQQKSGPLKKLWRQRKKGKKSSSP